MVVNALLPLIKESTPPFSSPAQNPRPTERRSGGELGSKA